MCDLLPSVSFFALSIVAVLLGRRFSRNNNDKARSKNVIVKELVIYPIKSCKGISVPSSEVTKTGFKYDRIFMVVDESGVFLSQRKTPKMALIETAISTDGLQLIINAPGMTTLVVNFIGAVEEPISKVKVWSDVCLAHEIVSASSWFSDFLGTPGLRLVRLADNFVRPTDPDYAAGGQTSFSDGYPFLLCSAGSIEKVNEAITINTSKPSEVASFDRFRPNIVVSGCTAFAEDDWEAIEFQSIPKALHARVVKPCSRCTIPDIDQASAEYDKERKVSRALQTFRTGSHLKLAKEKWQKELFFGQNVDHKAQEGMTIRVGDVVRILSVKV